MYQWWKWWENYIGNLQINIFKWDLENQIYRCCSIQEGGWQLHISNWRFYIELAIFYDVTDYRSTIVTFILYEVMGNLHPPQLILALQLMIRQTFNSLKSLFYWWRGQNYRLGKKSLLLSCFYSTREYKSQQIYFFPDRQIRGQAIFHFRWRRKNAERLGKAIKGINFSTNIVSKDE